MPDALYATIRDRQKAITALLDGAISPDEATARELIPLTNMQPVVTWQQRQDFWRFWQDSQHSAPVLVRVDERRVRLFVRTKPTQAKKRDWSFQ